MTGLIAIGICATVAFITYNMGCKKGARIYRDILKECILRKEIDIVPGKKFKGSMFDQQLGGDK